MLDDCAERDFSGFVGSVCGTFAPNGLKICRAGHSLFMPRGHDEQELRYDR